jgi:hypothetical protein
MCVIEAGTEVLGYAGVFTDEQKRNAPTGSVRFKDWKAMKTG